MSDQATATEGYGAQSSVSPGRSRVESAPIALRVLAYIADLCVASTVVALALIVDVAAGLEMGWILVGVGAAIAIVASIVLHGVFGASPGKILAGLRVVDADSHRTVGFPAAAIRSVVFNVLAPLVYLPGWSVLADGARRGIHEKASRTTTVDEADVATVVRAPAPAPSGPLGGLVTGEPDRGLQRIPTPLPEETRIDPIGAEAATEVVEVEEPRERMAPPELPPLPDDVPGLRPIPPRFGPPPTDGDEQTAAFPPAAAFAPPPQAPQQTPPPQAPQQTPPPQAPQGPGPQQRPGQQFPPGPVGPSGPVGPGFPGGGRPAPAGRPMPQPPRPAAPTPIQSGGVPIVLRFDDGHSVDVRGDGIIGREPVLPAGADSSTVTKHVLVDDTASVSKTHLLFGITRGELWVEDVGSTNGSAIAFGDSWTELTKGIRYAVEKGSVVHMGQRSFKVFGG
ncbi:RDD family protein [Tsukamurella pseudospumae]|uniref:RDD family protein n=1 Tax=Tsukamurella pseudospumae TaxID=239498 RepID=UPI0009ECFFAB|nr:RDD family protein [Tsukamurella pseudospumae]